MPEEKSDVVVLRDRNGQRVYDEADVPALVAFIDIEVTLIDARRRRLLGLRRELLSWHELHLVEFGHEFAHGCCAPARPPAA
jgi:hypothetical protein